ncbi:hypothetical protein AB870_26330 [Pandoraea faecigallinarum]|uniref:cold-shock protein n=1 Tax=Pandoraea faecigallinarum TaxID=656179 RepID=UPI000654F272|nr:cold shock domain-containing protein [Pandoraea faecigallinarum]AOX47802.1 hypothetical protein AB870_26330 [Pandoraea faecigallinarum]
MARGTVVWLDPVRGIAFITPSDGGADVFLPPATLIESGHQALKGGQLVEYEVSIDAKNKPFASSVRAVD